MAINSNYIISQGFSCKVKREECNSCYTTQEIAGVRLCDKCEYANTRYDIIGFEHRPFKGEFVILLMDGKFKTVSKDDIYDIRKDKNND